jgi:hypothetical protein
VTRETDALKRPFLVGVLAVGIVVVLLGGLIALFGSTDDRPEGVAERWLTAVGDLTRKGVHDDALKRVNAHGDVALAEKLLENVKAGDKSAFTTLEVGKAFKVPDTGEMIVPAMLVGRDSDRTIRIVLYLGRDKDSWRVQGFDANDIPAAVPGQPAPYVQFRVPSDGGDVASKAPISLYAIALVIGVGVAAGASTLVRVAGREQDRLLHA